MNKNFYNVDILVFNSFDAIIKLLSELLNTNISFFKYAMFRSSEEILDCYFDPSYEYNHNENMQEITPLAFMDFLTLNINIYLIDCLIESPSKYFQEYFIKRNLKTAIFMMICSVKNNIKNIRFRNLYTYYHTNDRYYTSVMFKVSQIDFKCISNCNLHLICYNEL